MAKTFTDRNGREWELRIDVACMRRAKKKGIDLSMPVQQLHEFLFDDTFLCDALWCVISPHAKGVTPEAFEAGLDGNVLKAAKDALFEALMEYFDPGKAEMLRAALESAEQELEKAITSVGSGSVKES